MDAEHHGKVAKGEVGGQVNRTPSAVRREGRNGGGSLRGYFGVGVEGVSKPMNLGNLVRIAHAFDASFFFSVAPRLKLSDANSDTSNAEGVLPFYSFNHPDDFRL